MGFFLTLYIAASVFGVGITLIDLFSGIGDHDSSGGHDADGLDGPDVGGAADDGGDLDADTVGDLSGHIDGHLDGHIDGDGGADLGDADVDGDADSDGYHESLVAHDRGKKRNPLFRIVTALRSLIYFSLGFGPVGLFGTLTGMAAGTTLLWSLPSGLGSLIIARLLRRLLKTELNSAVSDGELIMSAATVLVTIKPGFMGKIRIKTGGAYVDRYARGKDPSREISKDSIVRVVDYSEECLIVEEEQ